MSPGKTALRHLSGDGARQRPCKLSTFADGGLQTFRFNDPQLAIRNGVDGRPVTVQRQRFAQTQNVAG